MFSPPIKILGLNNKGKANKIFFPFKILFGVCAYLLFLINFTTTFLHLLVSQGCREQILADAKTKRKRGPK